jgi:GxxExxY protein
MELNQLSSKIIKAAITVHSDIGPGLLESVYQSCMRTELEHMGLCNASDEIGKTGAG